MKGFHVLHAEETSQKEALEPRPLPSSESTGALFLTNNSNCGQLGSEYNELDFAGQFSSYSIESPVELLHDVWDGVWKKVTHIL
ncbi:hypothetical protein B0A52_04355 [Exophiala mesophila]|uniref:Uncharacterized protein n=1 Tax=Exophiala mesophila TaxID=212818 RepID=A0A438N8N5_EXOME|nr:hypothetical protein B0A52_04355 [Exophiala mesophila]